MTDYILIGLVLVTIVLLIVAVCQLAALRRRQGDTKALEDKISHLEATLLAEQRAGRQESTQSVQAMSQVLLTAQGQANQAMTESLENIRRAVSGQLDTIRQENNRQLEQMRQTVDEKLQKCS